MVLLHFTFNFCAEVVQLPDSAILWRSFWEILLALVITTRWLLRPRSARSENTL